MPKLGGYLTDAELKESIYWLQRSDVRLISSSPENEEEKFELAHERMIPALRRLAGKQLSDTERADQLLDRRTNEWLGNGRHYRYRFSRYELRLINKHKHFITWGKERQAKEELLAISRRRFRLQYATTCLVMLLTTIGWIGWNSNAWQTYLIKRDLRSYGNSSNDEDALTEIARAFIYAGDSGYSLKIIERIKDDSWRAPGLSAMAASYAWLGDKEKASALLTEAIKTASQIRNDSDKTSALSRIAASIALPEKTMMASVRLKEMFIELKKESVDASKADALRTIAEYYSKLEERDKARELLDEAVKTANRISRDYSKVDTLRAIADSLAKLGDNQKASTLLTEAIMTAQRVTDDWEKAYALSRIAESIVLVGEKEKANALLSEALNTAQRISYNNSKASALRAIADSLAKLGDKPKASASSSLNFGVEPLQFHASVFDPELPVDATLFGIGSCGPSCDLDLQFGQIAETAVAQTLACQATQFAFGDV